MHFLIRYGVDKINILAVKRLMRDKPALFSVKRVAYKRVAKIFHMNANLMGPSRFKPQLKKRGAVTPFLYGGRRNYLVLRRCNKPTLIRESHHTRSVALWNFLRSHTQNKRKRFVDFLPKSAAKLHKYFHIQKSFSFMSEKVCNFAACKPQNLRLINRTTI